METFEMETEYFRRAIEYYADEANWKGGQTRLSELYGCSNSYINMIIKKVKKPSYKVQNKFADILKIPREQLLEIGKSLPESPKDKTTFSIKLPAFQMQGQAYSPPPPEPRYSEKIPPVQADPENPIISLQEEAGKKHAEVIAGFQDKEKALRLNTLLVAIEKLSPEKLLKIEGYLESILHDLQETADTETKGTGTAGRGN